MTSSDKIKADTCFGFLGVNMEPNHFFLRMIFLGEIKKKSEETTFLCSEPQILSFWVSNLKNVVTKPLSHVLTIGTPEREQWSRQKTEDDLHRNQNNGAALWNGPGLLHKQTHESCLNILVYINKLAVNYPTESSLSVIIKPLCGSRAMFAKYKDKSCLHRYRLERIHTYGVHVVVPQSFRRFTRKQPLEGNKLRIQ